MYACIRYVYSTTCMFNYYSSGDQAFVFLIIYYITLHAIVGLISVTYRGSYVSHNIL